MVSVLLPVNTTSDSLREVMALYLQGWGLPRQYRITKDIANIYDYFIDKLL
jgi:hypothetical protein